MECISTSNRARSFSTFDISYILRARCTGQRDVRRTLKWHYLSVDELLWQNRPQQFYLVTTRYEFFNSLGPFDSIFIACVDTRHVDGKKIRANGIARRLFSVEMEEVRAFLVSNSGRLGRVIGTVRNKGLFWREVGQACIAQCKTKSTVGQLAAAKWLGQLGLEVVSETFVAHLATLGIQ